jgi:hypothetical protein
MSYKGYFKPVHPEKYRGDPTNIIYRSSYELKFMLYLDKHPNIIEWASEEFCIPYRSPVDNKIHRYFPDFYVKKKNMDGTIEVLVIEIKPASQTRPPEVKKNNKSRRYIREVVTYGINEAKWKAATAFCEDRKWKFVKLTEKELGIKN